MTDQTDNRKNAGEPSEQLSAADRISQKLRRRKRQNKVRSVVKKSVAVAALAAVVILGAVCIYRYWDVFKPESFQKAVTVRDNSKSLMKIGGAMDIVTGNTAQYVPFASGLAVVTTTSVRYATEDGAEGFMEEVALNKPAVAVAENSFAVYDRGGKTVVSAGSSGILAEGETLGTTIGLSVNRDGVIAAVTECEGYKCAVTVYDKYLNRIYTWKTPEYFASAGIVSADGRRLAVAAVYTKASKLCSAVLLFDLQKEGVAAVVELGGSPVVALRENAGGFLIVTDADAVSAAWDGTILSRVSFQGEKVAGLAADGDGMYILLDVTSDVTAKYRLIRIGGDGAKTAEVALKCDIQAMTANNGMIAILTGNQIRLYDSALAIKKYISPEPGVTNIVMMKNNKLVMITAQEIFIA